MKEEWYIYQSAIIVLNLTVIMCHRLLRNGRKKWGKFEKTGKLGGKGSSIA